jgi:hypothetical protein
MEQHIFKLLLIKKGAALKEKSLFQMQHMSICNKVFKLTKM